jgi:hypothetical protein
LRFPHAWSPAPAEVAVEAAALVEVFVVADALEPASVALVAAVVDAEGEVGPPWLDEPQPDSASTSAVTATVRKLRRK